MLRSNKTQTKRQQQQSTSPTPISTRSRAKRTTKAATSIARHPKRQLQQLLSSSDTLVTSEGDSDTNDRSSGDGEGPAGLDGDDDDDQGQESDDGGDLAGTIRPARPKFINALATDPTYLPPAMLSSAAYTHPASSGLSSASSVTSTSRTSLSPSRRSRSPVKNVQDLKTLRVPVIWTTMKTSKTVSKALFVGADGTDTGTGAEHDDYGLRRLVQDLASIATRNTAFVPQQLRNVLADDDDFECNDNAFGPDIYNQEYWGGSTTTTPPPLSGQRQGQGQCEEDIDDNNNNTIILHELGQLRDIINNTVRCQDLGRSEAAWNDKVHSRMLDLGTKLVEESVQAENITRAKIASPFIPDGPASILSSGAASALRGIVDSTGIGGSSSSAVPAKLVDYALVLQLSDPQHSLSRRLVQFVAAQSRKPSPATCIASSSSSRATRPSQQPPLLQPSGSGDPFISNSSAVGSAGAASLPTFHMFNQTPYRPLVYAPAGVFIETKAESGSLDEGRLQLGLWVSAWFKRVSMFGSLASDAPQAGGQAGGQRSGLPLPIIPLVLVKSDAWEVFFARHSSMLLSCSSSSTSLAQAQAQEDEPRIDIIGPLKIGNTGDLASAYQLLLALRRLSFWVQDRSGFRGWVERVVEM